MAVKLNKCKKCGISPLVDRRFDAYIVKCPSCNEAIIANTIPKGIAKWNAHNRVIGGK